MFLHIQRKKQYDKPMYRTLIILTLAQAFTLTGPPMVILLGGIVGATLAPSASLATLPVALMIIGTASTTIPAALFMERFGRRTGFLLGAGYACAAGFLAAFAIDTGSFWTFCAATFLVGSNNAFVQQYRFAVAESVPLDKVGNSLSILMLAGVFAAYAGPETAQQLHDSLNWGEYSGSFVGMSGFMLCAFILLAFYPNSQFSVGHVHKSQRTLLSIVQHPVFILAAGAAAAGYAVMSLIMTATPISMHTQEHFSLEDTTWVIQSHIMAMYLPSLFSGFLISRFGAKNIIGIGLVLLFACITVAYLDRQLMHYWWALVLLGIGWNFLFLGGTTLLTSTYATSERFKVQAFNDFCVFTLQAVAALGSGYLLVQFGWHWVLALSLPWLVFLLPLLWLAKHPANPALTGSHL